VVLLPADGSAETATAGVQICVEVSSARGVYAWSPANFAVTVVSVAVGPRATVQVATPLRLVVAPQEGPVATSMERCWPGTGAPSTVRVARSGTVVPAWAWDGADTVTAGTIFAELTVTRALSPPGSNELTAT